MPNHRRAYIPGSTVFLTWVTYHRAPLSDDPYNITLHNITLLRQATGQAKNKTPFEIGCCRCFNRSDPLYLGTT